MRGEPVPLPVPKKGLILNIPPQEVPPDGLLGGQNTILDLDGLYKPRFGYFPFLGQPALGIGPVIGLLWWRDTMGANHYLAVSPSGIAAMVNNLWTTISTSLTGSLNDPARMIAYFQNSAMNVLVANNHDPIQQWVPGQPTALPLTPAFAVTGTGAPYVGTTIPPSPSIPLNTQLFFTPQVTNTGAVTLALNGALPAPVYTLVNGVATNVVLGQIAAGQVYNISYNGTYFLIGTNIQAPIARDLATIAQRVVAINITAHDILGNTFRNILQVTWTSAFDATSWPALAFIDLTDSDDELIAIRNLGSFAGVIYGRQSAWLMQAIPGAQDSGAFQFTPIQGVTTGPCSSAAVVVAEGLHYFLTTDFQVWACDGSSQWEVGAAINPLLLDVNPQLQTQVHGVYYSKLRQIWWFFPSLTDDDNGPTRAVVYSLGRGQFGAGAWETVQVFQEVLRASCQSALGDETLVMFLGGDNGLVYDFNRSINADGLNVLSIPYSFTPGFVQAGPGQDLLPNSIDLFLQIVPPVEGIFPELMELDFFALSFPFATPIPYTSMAVMLNDPTTFQLPQFYPNRQPTAPVNIYLQYIRYFQLTFSGDTINRGFAYGGGTFFVNRQARGSINKN